MPLSFDILGRYWKANLAVIFQIPNERFFTLGEPFKSDEGIFNLNTVVFYPNEGVLKSNEAVLNSNEGLLNSNDGVLIINSGSLCIYGSF